MVFFGKNSFWMAIWDCSRQSYYIYYKNNFFSEKFKFSDIESYLN